MEELVEILLPTYNGEKYLKEQIDSILVQSYQNIRLIISDDASTDATIEILKEYEKQDHRIVVHFHESNQGVVKNIEFLLKQVKAPFFMLADQDDYWRKDKVKKSMELLQKENADLVFGDLEVVDSSLNTIYASFNDYMLLTRKINKYLHSQELNYLYNCVTGCTICVKSEMVKYILPLPNISKFVIHDYWIGLMVSLHGKVAYLPQAYIQYRQHGDNQVGTEKISHGFSKFQEVRDWFLKIKLEIFGTYVQNNERFPAHLQELNVNALQYYTMLTKKKYVNFSGWKVFHKLYKTETFLYYIENFLILNLPFLAKIVFYIRLKILRILGKRK